MSRNITDLIILRHGEAGYAPADHERTLTKTGQTQIRQQYFWLKEQGLKPELILYSPYQRTFETAGLATDFFPEVTLQVEPLLTPDADPALAASFLLSLEQKRIMVVSHMPMVADLTASFLSIIQILYCLFSVMAINGHKI